VRLVPSRARFTITRATLTVRSSNPRHGHCMLPGPGAAPGHCELLPLADDAAVLWTVATATPKTGMGGPEILAARDALPREVGDSVTASLGGHLPYVRVPFAMSLDSRGPSAPADASADPATLLSQSATGRMEALLFVANPRRTGRARHGQRHHRLRDVRRGPLNDSAGTGSRRGRIRTNTMPANQPLELAGQLQSPAHRAPERPRRVGDLGPTRQNARNRLFCAAQRVPKAVGPRKSGPASCFESCAGPGAR
jgi:hypothetical protein